LGALRDGDAVSLRLKSDARYLCLVRAMIGSFGGLMGFGADHVHRIILAVDEGCTNIIRHAHGGRPDGDIEVTCRAELLPSGRRQLVVVLVDDGSPAEDARLCAGAASDPLTPGGLGLKLMRDIMDDVRFSRSEDGRNRLELTLACPDTAATPPG